VDESGVFSVDIIPPRFSMLIYNLHAPYFLRTSLRTFLLKACVLQLRTPLRYCLTAVNHCPEHAVGLPSTLFSNLYLELQTVEMCSTLICKIALKVMTV
jgi:hypothetical protein